MNQKTLKFHLINRFVHRVTADILSSTVYPPSCPAVAVAKEDTRWIIVQKGRQFTLQRVGS